MTVTDLKNQQFSGDVHHVYSRRFEGPEPYDRGPLYFVGSAGNWGNVTLGGGEKALVFIRYLQSSKRYYQEYSQGHFTLSEQEGTPLAIANWRLLDAGIPEWQPSYLYDSAFMLDSEKPWRVAMPFSLLEQHLIEELDRIKDA